MIHTHNDNSVNFLSPGSGGRKGGEDFGGSLSCQGNVGEGGGSVVPNGIFRGWYIIANHKRAVVLYCLCYMQRRNMGQPLPLVAIFFLECYAKVSVFSREIKELPTYLSFKNKKIQDRVDSRFQLVCMLRVMGSWLKF